jgi:S1-C subfamily serine protease
LNKSAPASGSGVLDRNRQFYESIIGSRARLMQLYSAKPIARNGLGMALLATTIASLGAAALAFSPAMPSRSALITAAQAENLSEKVQQIPQRPVGFADIVEKVKPAVISVKVKIDRPADSDSSDQDLPFPPGSPFERFFKRFGMPNTPKDHEVIIGRALAFSSRVTVTR